MASSEIVRIGFAKQPFMQTIGAQLASVGTGKCEIFLPFDAKPVSYTHLTLPTICSV